MGNKRKRQPYRLPFGTPDENRTHNCPLGGDCYIHLTTEAYLTLTFLLYSFFCEIAIVFRALVLFSFLTRSNASIFVKL